MGRNYRTRRGYIARLGSGKSEGRQRYCWAGSLFVLCFASGPLVVTHIRWSTGPYGPQHGPGLCTVSFVAKIHFFPEIWTASPISIFGTFFFCSETFKAGRWRKRHAGAARDQTRQQYACAGATYGYGACLGVDEQWSKVACRWYVLGWECFGSVASLFAADLRSSYYFYYYCYLTHHRPLLKLFGWEDVVKWGLSWVSWTNN